MPHLHLPIDHTDDDLVLAANVAEVVGSQDLYVAWSHESGPGAVPEVEALVRHERTTSRLAGVLAAIRATLAALLGRRAERGEDRPAPPSERPRREAGDPT